MFLHFNSTWTCFPYTCTFRLHDCQEEQVIPVDTNKVMMWSSNYWWNIFRWIGLQKQTKIWLRCTGFYRIKHFKCRPVKHCQIKEKMVPLQLMVTCYTYDKSLQKEAILFSQAQLVFANVYHESSLADFVLCDYIYWCAYWIYQALVATCLVPFTYQWNIKGTQKILTINYLL